MNLQKLQSKADHMGRVQFDPQSGLLVYPSTTTGINLYTQVVQALDSEYFFNKGKFFIVDRTGTLQRFGLAKLAWQAHDYILDKYQEQAAMSSEAQDPKSEAKFSEMHEYLREVPFTVSPIKGHTADGFKLEMLPSLSVIEKLKSR